MKGVEFTAGRANITLDKDKLTKGDHSADVSWVFEGKAISLEEWYVGSLPPSPQLIDKLSTV